MCSSLILYATLNELKLSLLRILRMCNCKTVKQKRAYTRCATFGTTSNTDNFECTIIPLAVLSLFINTQSNTKKTKIIT